MLSFTRLVSWNDPPSATTIEVIFEPLSTTSSTSTNAPSDDTPVTVAKVLPVAPIEAPLNVTVSFAW